MILRADTEATHGRLTALMAAAKDAGAMSLTIATQQDISKNATAQRGP